MLINDYVGVAELTINSIEPTAQQETISGRDIVTKSSNQKWEFTITTTIMDEVDYMAFQAQLVSLGGAYTSFQFKPLTGNYNADKTDVVTSGAVLAGETVVPINTHGLILSGTLIKFANHSKVYQVVSSTTTQLTIYPALRDNLALSESGVIDRPVVSVRMNSDMSGITIGSANIAQAYDMTMVEGI